MRADLDGGRQVSLAEHLDRFPRAGPRPGRRASLARDLATVGEQRGDPVEVDHLVPSRFRLVKPFSLGSRMCSGIWPPSNPAEI